MGYKPKIAIVIDDEEFIRNILAEVLSQLGFDTHLYASAFEVPCIVRPPNDHCSFGDFIPDVLISDIQMPGMSGVELLRQMKKIGCRIEKVALMTGYSNENLQKVAKELDCMAFQKPFSIDEIKEWVNS